MLLRTLAFDATKHSAKALLSDGDRCDKPKVSDVGSARGNLCGMYKIDQTLASEDVWRMFSW